MRPQLGQVMWHRLASAPELHLEGLLEVAQLLRADTPPCLEQPPGLPLHQAPQDVQQTLKQELALPPGLVLEL